MKPISLREIADSCQGELHGDENIIITSIVTDSRKANAGALFAAIKGERADGHDFIKKTAEQGAACALCEKKPDAAIPYILVDSTLQALKKIAEYYRSLFSIPFIGITGSVGKTSTKEFIASVLSQKYSVHKTAGNFNNELGVPLTLFGLEEHHEAAVIEMGISDFGEMTRLAKMVKPNIAVITNIGCCHLENLIDRDGVLKAKTEMFCYLKDDGKIFLNGDDDKLRTVKEYRGIAPVFFGIDRKNAYYAENITDNLTDGINCRLCSGDRKIDVTIPAIGVHMVQNALAAMAVGEALGLSGEEIKRGVENFKNVGARSNVIKTEKITVIDDCYNANPTSVKASIDTLASFKTRTVAILGDMKELGAHEKELHREVGKYVKEKNIGVLITAGPLAQYLAEGHGNAVSFKDVEECLENIGSLIKDGDTVLVKASHSMHFEKITDALKGL